MTVYDPTRLAVEIAALPEPAVSPTAQGRKLQDLVEWLISLVRSCEVEFRNKQDAGNTEEKDLWFRHFPSESRLPFSDWLVPIECKNEVARVSSEDVATFGRKIKASGGSDGILVARTGLAGGPLTSAHLAIRDQLQAGVRIVVLTSDDLRPLETADDLVGLIIDRHTELRTEQTYRTI